MKVKTAEATGLQLDWGLAKATGKRVRYYLEYNALAFNDCEDNLYLFSHTDPAVCMSLIKEHCVQLYPFCKDGKAVHWDADIRPYIRVVGCDTPEIAVARCVIAMRLGDEFECPDELESV